MTPDKALELKRSKRRALWLLLAAVAVFVTTILLPRGPWVDGIKAVAEAAMVGALADWFAVVALFRRVPIPFVSRHTEIIPKNKDKIADNLAVFVREKFLGGCARRADPPARSRAETRRVARRAGEHRGARRLRDEADEFRARHDRRRTDPDVRA